MSSGQRTPVIDNSLLIELEHSPHSRALGGGPMSSDVIFKEIVVGRQPISKQSFETSSFLGKPDTSSYSDFFEK